MKITNEALQTVRRHGAEYVLECMRLTTLQFLQIKQEDPEEFERVKRIRTAMSRQLAINTRNVNYED